MFLEGQQVVTIESTRGGIVKEWTTARESSSLPRLINGSTNAIRPRAVLQRDVEKNRRQKEEKFSSSRIDRGQRRP